MALLLSACGSSPKVAIDYDWSGLASTLDSYVSSGKIQGYSFVLFERDSGTLFERAGGDQKLQTQLDIASATKLPSVLAILTLVDSGKLDLDQTVASYLEGSAVSWPADKAAITVRMLLDHTSGLRGLNESPPACVDEPELLTLAECVQEIADSSLAATPGSVFDYGGADYQVAGYIAVLLSGAANWQDFFAAAVSGPLGLSAYSYGDAAIDTNPRIAGGATTDVLDYATILRAVLDGGYSRLGASVIANPLEVDQISGLPVDYYPSPLTVQDYPGYSLGLFISSSALHPGSPGPEFSDPGKYGSVPWYDTGLGYGAVLLIDQEGATGVDIWNAVRPIIIGQLTRS